MLRAPRHWIGPLVAVAVAAFSVPATASLTHEEQVERALFELCPKVLSGELDLSDPQKVAELGYRIPEADFKRPTIEMGTDRTTILILGPSETELACSAVFAAPKASLFHRLEKIARRRGFDGPPSTALSSTLRFLNLTTLGDRSLRFTMFDIDEAGGVEFRPLLAAGLAPAD